MGTGRLLVGLACICVPNLAWGATFVPQNGALGLATSWSSGYADSGTGVSWRDLDGDGYHDLVVTAPTSLPRLYKGTSAGGVEEVPFGIVPAKAPGFSVGHILVDVDGDGDLDLLLLAKGTNHLLRNDGGMTFVDVSETQLPGLVAPSFSAAAGDLDGDGDTDIVVANNVEFSAFPRNECARNHWLINDGSGRFEHRPPVLVEEPGALAGCTLAVALTDVDGDGDLDLIEANDFGTFVQRNRVWRNDGVQAANPWTFTEIGLSIGLAQRRFSMTAAVGDLNDDGLLDHLTSNIGRPFVAAGQADGSFVEVTDAWNADGMTFGANGYAATWDSRIADFDGDGFQDAIVVAGFVSGAGFLSNDQQPEMVVLSRDPAGQWAVNPPGWMMPKPDGGTARGMAVADVDGDGDLDVVLALTQGVPFVYRNDSAGQLPLRVTLTPTATDSPVGARIWATCGGVTRLREATGGGATSGTGGVPIHFTFPAPCNVPAAAVDLLVRWPSGYTQSLESVTGGIVALTEPQWLTLSGTTVTLAPTDSVGSLAPMATVAVTAVGGTVGPLTEVANGYQAALAPTGDATEAVLSIAVDGWMYAARPRIPWDQEPWALRLRPQNAVAGRSSSVRVDVAGPAQVALQVGEMAPIELTPATGGTFTGELPAWTEAGPVAATLVVDGAPWGDAKTINVLPPVAPERSKVDFDGLHGTNGPTLLVTGRVADINGVNWVPTLASLSLLVDGVPFPGLYFESFGGDFLITFNTSNWAPGADLQLTFKGEAIGQPQTLWRGLSPSPTGAEQLDPDRSWCSLARPALRADNEDVSVLFVGLRDAGGSPVVTDEPIGLSMQGLVIGPEGTLVLDSLYQFDVVHSAAIGPVASPVAIEVTIDGLATGVTCTIDLLAPSEVGSTLPGPGQFGAATTLVASETVIAAPGSNGQWPSQTELRLMPRWPNGRLVGSGLGVSWSTNLGTLQGGFYDGIGRYSARLVAGDEGGLATVIATTAAGESWQVEVTIEATDGGEPDGAEEGPSDVAPESMEVPDELADVPLGDDDLADADVGGGDNDNNDGDGGQGPEAIDDISGGSDTASPDALAVDDGAELGNDSVDAEADDTQVDAGDAHGDLDVGEDLGFAPDLGTDPDGTIHGVDGRQASDAETKPKPELLGEPSSPKPGGCETGTSNTPIPAALLLAILFGLGRRRQRCTSG